ncbi:MAG: hypothetical protein U0670_22145 [Anaerolineae bacterium]
MPTPLNIYNLLFKGEEYFRTGRDDEAIESLTRYLNVLLDPSVPGAGVFPAR